MVSVAAITRYKFQDFPNVPRIISVSLSFLNWIKTEIINSELRQKKKKKNSERTHRYFRTLNKFPDRKLPPKHFNLKKKKKKKKKDGVTFEGRVAPMR